MCPLISFVPPNMLAVLVTLKDRARRVAFNVLLATMIKDFRPDIKAGNKLAKS